MLVISLHRFFGPKQLQQVVVDVGDFTECLLVVFDNTESDAEEAGRSINRSFYYEKKTIKVDIDFCIAVKLNSENDS